MVYQLETQDRYTRADKSFGTGT